MAEATTPLDISSLNYAELEALATRASQLALQKRQQEHLEQKKREEKDRKALLKSPKYQKARAKYKELQKKLDDLAGRGEFTVLVPLVVKYKAESPNLADLVDNDSTDPLEHFTFEKSGKLGDGDLSRRQRDTLKPTVEQYVRNACDQIFELAPDGLFAEHAKVLRECQHFLNRLDEDEIDVCDIS